MNMNMNLLNAIPVPFPSGLRPLHFARVDIAALFPPPNSALLKLAWKVSLSEKLRAMSDLRLVHVVATTGWMLKELLETVFTRAESMAGKFTLQPRKLGNKRSRGMTGERPPPLFRSSHHAYRDYSLSGDSHIFTQNEADKEFWCNEIIDLASAILYFQR
jgi:hypothetical protein